MIGSWQKTEIGLWTINGGKMACEGKGKVMLAAGKSIGSLVDVIVVGERPLGFYFILGMNGRDSRWCKNY